MEEEVHDYDHQLLKDLHDAVNRNIYALDSHLELIRFLRSERSLQKDELCRSRSLAVQKLNLPEEEYLSWLEDEIENPSPDGKLDQVFDKAIEAWPSSVPLWNCYLNYVTDKYSPSEDPGSHNKISTTFESALSRTEYDMSSSHIIWNHYCDYLMSNLYEGSPPDELTKIKSLFLQRLSIPHNTLNDTFALFSSFIAEYDASNYEEELVKANAVFSQTKTAVARREDYELMVKNDPSINAYAAYIDSELSQNKKFFNKKLIQALYERALSKYYNIPEVWDDYIVFLQDKVGEPKTILDVSRRARRMCPWSGLIWSHYLNNVRTQYPAMSYEKISSMLTTSLLHSPFFEPVSESNFHHRRDIELTLISLANRENDIHQLNNVINATLPFLPNSCELDPSMSLELTIIGVYTRHENMEAARAIWKLCSKYRISQSDFWLAWIRWEAFESRSLEYVRDVIQKSLQQSSLDYPDKILDESLLLERQFGTSFSIESTYARARSLIKVINRKKWQAEAENTREPVLTKTSESQHVSSSILKRSHIEDNDSKETTSTSTKKVKVEQEDNGSTKHTTGEHRDREHTSVIASNIPQSTTEKEITDFFSDCGAIKEITMHKLIDDSTCAIVEFYSHADALAALTKSGKQLNGSKIFVDSGENTTVWVTNFAPSLTASDLENLFETCGVVLSVRLPSLKYNAKRRFAYIQYMSAEHAKAAVEQFNGYPTTYEGKDYALMVEISNPDRKKSKPDPSSEKREIIVKGMDYKMTKDDIRRHFEKYGSVEKLNIPPSRHDNTRAHDGYAFITYETAKAADAAVSSENSSKLRGRRITVLFATDGKAKNHSQTSKEPNSSDSTLYIHNLADTVSQGQLSSMFSRFGKIHKTLLFPKEERACIQFEHASDAGRASLALEGTTIAGKQITISDNPTLAKKPTPMKPITAFAPRSTYSK